MANPAINLSYSGQGPTGSGQVMASSVESGAGAQAIDAFGSSVTDNTGATITVNYIDGTKTLSFTPSAVLASLSGDSANIQAFKVDSISNTGFVITGAATWTAGTVKFAFRLIK